jgi:imidazolonepropionase-like amidohydrolase
MGMFSRHNQDTDNEERRRTTYRAPRLLTGVPGEEIADGAVIVEGDKIEWVGPASELPENTGDVQEYGEDATIMPGMIDTHVHLAFDGSAEPVDHMVEADTLERYTTMLHSARELLSAGVTTARDLGAPDLLDVTVKHAIRDGKARGPRMLTVNAPITITGGHCYFFGCEAETVDGVRQAVRRARRDGADHIKIMSTGGNMTPGTLPTEPQFSVEELTTIVDEAHHFGMRVAAHCHGVEGIRRAMAAGVDSLEHFSFQYPDGSRRDDPDMVREAGDRGFYVAKTFCAALGHLLDDMPDAFEDNLTRKEVDAGVKIVAGTDAGIDFAPHLEYVFGLEGLSVYGMTHDEVLNAATALAAESLGLEDVTGKLEAGLEADLIVVDGNPRRDLRTLRNVEQVVARGVPYQPEFVAQQSWNEMISSKTYRPVDA